MAVLKRDTHHHTYADYLTWSRAYGDELIDGSAYVREPPAPPWSHQMIVGEIYRQIANAIDDKPWRVCVAPSDIRLPRSAEEDDQVDTVVQPDIFIVSDLRKVDARGLRGAPDWLAEVLSPSTAGYDKVTKLPIYERSGVREVWLIDPTERTVSLYRLDGNHFRRPAVLGLEGQTPLTVLDGVTIDWHRVLAKAS